MSYRNAVVRDLAWACFSPSLLLTGALGAEAAGIGNCSLALTAKRKSWLATLDADPTSLLDFLHARPTSRLGIYYERLWHFFLQDDPDVELIAHNLPVRDRGATLGEFDCLYYCRQRSRHVHLELAVKYYLAWLAPGQVPAPGRWYHWLGPNSADRLDLKINRMLGHQSTLGLSEPGRQVLAGLGIDDYLREVEIKGWLFQASREAVTLPPGINPLRATSNWIRLNELEVWLAEQVSSCYRVLPRLQWLAPAQADPEMMDREQLLATLHESFSAQQRPQLVAAFTPGQEETSRFFVVEEHWPAHKV